MSYEYITKYNSPNYTKGRQGNAISEIVIHHWGSDGQKFETPLNWLCRSNGTSSAHYIVEAGKVACIVDCANTAWHAGNWAHNLKSIGIECRPEMSDGDLETVCELVADLYKAYGVLPLIGHKDVAATSCPGRYYAKLSYIKSRAIEIMNGSASTSTNTNTSTNTSASSGEAIDQILHVGSYVTSGALSIGDVKSINGVECVKISALGGYFPTAYISEYDASDGAKDNYLANQNAKVYVDRCQVEAVNVKKNLVQIHGIWVDPTPLVEVE